MVPNKVFKSFVYEKVKTRAKAGLLALIRRDLEGEVINTAHAKSVLQIFVQMGMMSLDAYHEDLEADLLAETKSFYATKAAQWIQTDTCSAYLRKAEEYLVREEDRINRYLVDVSKEKILAVAGKELIEVHQTELLNMDESGCAALVANQQTDDLLRMFKLFRRVPNGLAPMADIYRSQITVEGKERMDRLLGVGQGDHHTVPVEVPSGEGGEKSTSSSKKSGAKELASKTAKMEMDLIRAIVDLNQQHLKVVKECFHEHPLFNRALKDAFENFCNQPVSKEAVGKVATFPELMATFCDTKLRKGGSASGEDEKDAEMMLEHVIKLITYVADKDLFGELYRKRLSKRLLGERSISDDQERLVLSNLKEQCGSQFTSKMEGMVRDLQMSKDRAYLFKEWMESRGAGFQPEATATVPPLDLTVTTLTTGFWPSYDASSFTLLPEMEAALAAYNMFYHKNTQHRKLQWVHTLGNVTVKATFGAKDYTIIMAPQQAVILGQFNDHERLTYAEIKERTGIVEDEELKRFLHSLCFKQYKLLLKHAVSTTKAEKAEKAIDTTDSFSINENFKEKLKRIRLVVPVLEDRKKVHEMVHHNRAPQIEAAIVRVMKARKSLAYNDLFQEVLQQCQRIFTPDGAAVNTAMNSLIDKDFLERDAENRKIIRYLA